MIKEADVQLSDNVLDSALLIGKRYNSREDVVLTLSVIIRFFTLRHQSYLYHTRKKLKRF